MIIYILYLLYQIGLLKPKPKNKSLEVLKNGLLSYALLKTSPEEDLKDFNMNYKSFDGNKLPMFSGYSTSNACLSYIIDKEDFKKSLFYTPIMEDKIIAIEKYLEKNFDSDKKVADFFDMFVELMDKNDVKEKEVSKVDEKPIENDELSEYSNEEPNIDIEIITKDDIETKIMEQVESESKKSVLKKRKP